MCSGAESPLDCATLLYDTGAMTTTEQRYTVELTWDEIDELQADVRASIYRWEDEAAKGEPSLVAEIDQYAAFAWAIVHRLGDARRAAHGQPLHDANAL